MVGEARGCMEFKYFFKLSIIPVLIMLIISLISFGIKSISGKSDFKKELMTGALCGIPLSLLIPFALLLKILTDSKGLMIMNPAGFGLIDFTIMLFLLVMMINVLQQSLILSGTKSAVAWYLSPVSIILSMYLATQII